MGVNMFMRTQHQIHYPNTSKDMESSRSATGACGYINRKTLSDPTRKLREEKENKAA